MATSTIETFRLLLISREAAVVRLLSSISESNLWELETAANGWDAMGHLQLATAPHLLLVDVPRGDADSLQLLAWLRRLRPGLALIALCHGDDKARRREVLRRGANEVLVKPFTGAELAAAIRKHFLAKDFIPQHGSFAGGDEEIEMASENLESVGEDEFFLSVSPAMQKLRAQAELLAQADVPVLILGEPGSGKETFARLLHKLSVYSGFKFARVNCAEMPGDLLEIELFGRGSGAGRASAGKLEAGEKGTLLLDEITEMPAALQARLLETLQARRPAAGREANGTDFGVRILAASSQDVERAIEESKLRADLYHRLSAFTVQVPALRQRKEEIRILLRYAMHKLARYYGLPSREFSPAALAWCQNHSWPGNMKELEAYVKRYLVAGDEELGFAGSEAEYGSERVAELAPSIKLRMPLAAALHGVAGGEQQMSLKSIIRAVKSEAEKNAIAEALEKTGWNRKAAARLLGVSYRAILYKIDEYHMSAPESYVSLSGARYAGLAPAKGSGKAS